MASAHQLIAEAQADETKSFDSVRLECVYASPLRACCIFEPTSSLCHSVTLSLPLSHSLSHMYSPSCSLALSPVYQSLSCNMVIGLLVLFCWPAGDRQDGGAAAQVCGREGLLQPDHAPGPGHRHLPQGSITHAPLLSWTRPMCRAATIALWMQLPAC